MVYDTVIALSKRKNVFNLRELESKPNLQSNAVAALVISLVLFSCLFFKNISAVVVNTGLSDKGYITLFLIVCFAIQFICLLISKVSSYC